MRVLFPQSGRLRLRSWNDGVVWPAVCEPVGIFKAAVALCQCSWILAESCQTEDSPQVRRAMYQQRNGPD